MAVLRVIAGVLAWLAMMATILAFLLSDEQKCAYLRITCPIDKPRVEAPPASNPVVQAPQVFPASLPPPSETEIELAFWKAIADSNNVALYEEYLRRYPNGQFAGIARLKIRALQQRAEQETSEQNRPGARVPYASEPEPVIPTPPATEASIVGHWQGHYYCAQGRTLLVVEVREGSHGLSGRFSFRPPYGARAGTGSYEVAVEQRGESVLLRPVRWLDRPPGYFMVGAVLRLVDRNRLHGRIVGSNCGEISLVRHSS